MNSNIRNAILSLIAVFAVLSILGGATNSWGVLASADPAFIACGAGFFMLSVLLWLVSWGYLLKKRTNLHYTCSMLAGAQALYGALTPIQLGAEAIRAMKLKEYFSIPYKESISAAMVSKGAKFLIISVAAVFSFLAFFAFSKISGIMFFAFVSGFFVVLLAALLFLLPLKKECGKAIAKFFLFLGKRISIINKLSDFFLNYSSYLQQTPKKTFLVVFLLALFSWLCEIAALQFSFFSLGIGLPLLPLVVLMVLVSILERTPFLPRGIGLVELVGYYFLASPQLTAGIALTAAQIGAVIIVYDVIRLIIPTIIGFAFNLVPIRSFQK